MSAAPMTQGAWDVSSESMARAMVLEGKVHTLRTEIAEDAVKLEADRAYVAMQTARLGAALGALAIGFDPLASGALDDGIHEAYMALRTANGTYRRRAAALDSKRRHYADMTLGAGEAGALAYAAANASDATLTTARAAHYAASTTGTDTALLSAYHGALEGQRRARYALALYFDRRAEQGAADAGRAARAAGLAG